MPGCLDSRIRGVQHRTVKTVWALVCLLCIGFAIHAGEPEPNWPSEVDFTRDFGGAGIFGVIRNAPNVRAVRLKEEPWLGRVPVAELGKPFELDPKIVQQAKTLLTDRRTYVDNVDECTIEPGVELTFDDPPQGKVTLLICYRCGDVAVLQSGKEVGSAHFDTGDTRLLDLALSIFPKDKELHALKDETEARIKANSTAN